MTAVPNRDISTYSITEDDESTQITQTPQQSSAPEVWNVVTDYKTAIEIAMRQVAMEYIGSFPENDPTMLNLESD